VTHDAALRRTAEHWSHYEPNVERSYFGFPPLRPYLVRTAFGEAAAEAHAENRWWAEDIVCDRYLAGRSPSKVLSLCCGFGAVEQHLLPRLPSVTACCAIDIAPLAVAEARRRAQTSGMGPLISYEVADLTAYHWPPEAFDLVIANGALHHLDNVEEVLDGVLTTLSPGGVLYANEHVGARHQDFGARQLELINAAAYIVPPDLRQRHPRRRNPFDSTRARRLADVVLGNADLGRSQMPATWGWMQRALAQVLRRFTLPPRADFGALVSSHAREIAERDPSECVSSDRIVAAVKQRFGSVNVHDYGGAVLAYALDDAFFRRFDAGSHRDTGLLTALCSLEATLVELGELPREHAIIVAVKSAAPPTNGAS
jgi:SAM-dependent methyltransferase